MKGLRRRVSGLCIALVTSLSVFATAQPATTPKERREERQEKREDRQEKREDKQEKREDRRDGIEDLRKTRQERRKEHLKEVRGRWGDVVGKPAAKAELKVHARRVARLGRARRLADSAGKTDLVAKIDKLIERESTRHQAAMGKLKTEGGKP